MKRRYIENFYTLTAQLHTNNPSNKQYEQTNSDIKSTKSETMQHRDREIVMRDSIFGLWKTLCTFLVDWSRTIRPKRFRNITFELGC